MKGSNPKSSDAAPRRKGNAGPPLLPPQNPSISTEEFKQKILKIYDRMTRQLSTSAKADNPLGAGLVGLKNLGNTCFMSSVLQCLVQTFELLEIFTREEVSSLLKSGKDFKVQRKIATKLAALLDAMRSGKFRVISPKNFLRHFPGLDKYEQEDASELLGRLLGTLDDVTDRTAKKDFQREYKGGQAILRDAKDFLKKNRLLQSSPVRDVFGMVIVSETSCGKCRQSSAVFVESTTLQIALPEKSCKLLDCIGSHFSVEPLEDFKCGKCKRSRTQTTQTTKIWRPPKVLVIQLGRFKHVKISEDEVQLLKNQVLFNFDHSSLDIAPFLHPKAPKENTLFKLYAATLHSGDDLNGGHYKAVTCNLRDGKWYQFNDTTVTACQPPTDKGSEVCTLFYKQCSNDEEVSPVAVSSIPMKKEQPVPSEKPSCSRSPVSSYQESSESSESSESEPDSDSHMPPSSSKMPLQKLSKKGNKRKRVDDTTLSNVPKVSKIDSEESDEESDEEEEQAKKIPIVVTERKNIPKKPNHETSAYLVKLMNENKQHFDNVRTNSKLRKKVMALLKRCRTHKLALVPSCFILHGKEFLCCVDECSVEKKDSFKNTKREIDRHLEDNHDRKRSSIYEMIMIGLDESNNVTILDYENYMIHEKEQIVMSRHWLEKEYNGWNDEILSAEKDTVQTHPDGHEFTKTMSVEGWKFCHIITTKHGLGAKWDDEKKVLKWLKAVGPNEKFSCKFVYNDKHEVMPVRELIRRYEEKDPQKREKRGIVNSLDMEVTNWKGLSKHLKPADFIRTFCLTDLVNKTTLMENGVLISMAGSFTDFHIDFGGVTTILHMISGTKIFYLVEPTSDHIRTLEAYLVTKRKMKIFTWFGNQPAIKNNIRKVLVSAGQTLVMPPGWIHAVYTQEDSVVYTSSFLNKDGIRKQLEIFDMETRMNVLNDFRVPHFIDYNIQYLETNLTEKVEACNEAKKDMTLNSAHQQTWQDFKEILDFLKNNEVEVPVAVTRAETKQLKIQEQKKKKK